MDGRVCLIAHPFVAMSFFFSLEGGGYLNFYLYWWLKKKNVRLGKYTETKLADQNTRAQWWEVIKNKGNINLQ